MKRAIENRSYDQTYGQIRFNYYCVLHSKQYSAFTILSVFEASTRQPWVLEAFLWQFLVLVKVLLKSLGIALVQRSLKCFCLFLVLVRVSVQTSTISISFQLEDVYMQG